MSQQTHRSDPAVLNRRTLEYDHRVLAGLLRPGMSVLDAGCGSGAITAGVARAVAPAEVVGIDRDASLLGEARAAHGDIPNLAFEEQDALTMPYTARFDVVTAARALQWMADPALVVRKMAEAVKPGGMVVVLDYNHAKTSWTPAPPPEFQQFYSEFLAWRERNNWSNCMGDELPELFAMAGLIDIQPFNSDEVAGRDTHGAAIMGHVITSIGPQFASPEEVSRAAAAFREYIATRLERQTLSMATVTGRRAV